MNKELRTQILIVGASTGGVAGALAAARMGYRVVLTEPTAWIGGQLTSQSVPPDESPWIETTGCTRSYRAFRDGVRAYYKRNHRLTKPAMEDAKLNPGGGGVSKLCAEPRVYLAVLEEMLAPYRTAGRVRVLLRHEPVAANVEGDRVRAVTLRDVDSGDQVTVSADYVLDATELGDLLPLTKTEYVTGAESQKEHGEPHAPAEANADNVQGLTWCFPLAYDPTPGANHAIEKPAQWARWRDYVPHLSPAWPGKLLSWAYSHPVTLKPQPSVLFPSEVDEKHPARSLFRYRQIVRADVHEEEVRPHEVTLVNWPQNDYWEHNVIDKDPGDVKVWLEEARQLSLSLVYWLQTEAPNHTTGGTGYPGLYLVPEISGAADGMALAPYVRESRRIRALFTVTERHVGTQARYGYNPDWSQPVTRHATTQTAMHAERCADSVGIGYYRIDLHPSTAGKNYIDVASLPFQIPLGALVPRRVTNLLAACKNIGTTHITNGCYRLHPIEWNIGESAALLACYCLEKRTSPQAVHGDAGRVKDFQTLLTRQGILLEWPAELK